MTLYCATGEKAILTYQFSGQPKKIVKFQFVPIDVAVKSVIKDSTSNYSKEGYQITAYSTSEFFTKGYTVTDYYVTDAKVSPDNHNYIYNFILYGRLCGQSEFTGLTYINPATIVINSSVHCPIPEETENSIQVTYKDKIIFSDQSKESVTFSVSCGDCPDGFCKCITAGYPGYCCLDCAETAANIRTITNELRTKNG